MKVAALSALGLAALAGGPTPAEPAPWSGGFAAGLDALARHAAADEVEAARAVGEALLAPTVVAGLHRRLEAAGGWRERAADAAAPALEAFGLLGWPEPVRAEVHYALGLVERAAGDVDASAAAFERASAAAGPGGLRADALYDAGTVVLEHAEELFAALPEVSGAPPAGAGPAGPSVPLGPGGPGGPGAAPDEPDPLDVCEAAYVDARERLVRRLRLDWHDEDVRANLEWIQRRLREIDDIRRQREEQQQQQQQQESSDEQDGDEGEDGEDGEPSDSQDAESEPESPDESPDEPESDEADAPAEPPEPEDAADEERPAPAPERAEPEERHLTREEVARLLDLLKEIEEEAEAQRAALRQQGRRPVEEDW